MIKKHNNKKGIFKNGTYCGYWTKYKELEFNDSRKGCQMSIPSSYTEQNNLEV